MNKKTYNQWASAMNNMIHSVVNEDFDKAQAYKIKADKLFENAVKEHNFFKQNINNFGLITPIIENRMVDLGADGDKKPMAEFIKMIKEDKNLRAQYKFYHAMGNYTTSAPSKEYVKEALREVKRCINEETINKSNQKLVNFMKKYNITKNLDMISEEKKDFYDACQYLLEKKSSTNTLANIYDNIESVAGYIEKNPRKKLTEDKQYRKQIINAVNDFNKKFSMLEGKECEIFNILLEAKSETDSDDVKKAKDERKLKLLNDMKADCISKMNSIEPDASEEEKGQIEEMKNLVNSMVYEEDTIVQNIAKLLEIREILAF